MKSLILAVFSAMFYISASAQLNTLHNHLRAGDVLIKQQVEYKDPGKPGNKQFWDFSQLKTLNDAYSLSYSLPPMDGDSIYIMGSKRYVKKKVKDNELIVGLEHNTLYYYQLRNDSLYLLGHENPSVTLEYTHPYLVSVSPLSLGQTIGMNYASQGLYSATVPFSTQGNIQTAVDAYGKMVLPSGDTLNPVIRVRTVQTIQNASSDYADDLVLQKQVETCRWYTKGYRYPVFETIRNINTSDSTQIFATAFFFPPQQHLYLSTDPENQQLLDEAWDVDKSKTKTSSQTDVKPTPSIEDILTYKVYPNPVETQLNIEYTLKEDAPISIYLYSMDGNLLRKIDKKQQAKGTYQETLNCGGLLWGSYVLRITAYNDFINHNVIKK